MHAGLNFARLILAAELILLQTSTPINNFDEENTFCFIDFYGPYCAKKIYFAQD